VLSGQVDPSAYAPSDFLEASPSPPFFALFKKRPCEVRRSQNSRKGLQLIIRLKLLDGNPLYIIKLQIGHPVGVVFYSVSDTSRLKSSFRIENELKDSH